MGFGAELFRDMSLIYLRPVIRIKTVQQETFNANANAKEHLTVLSDGMTDMLRGGGGLPVKAASSGASMVRGSDPVRWGVRPASTNSWVAVATAEPSASSSRTLAGERESS